MKSKTTFNTCRIALALFATVLMLVLGGWAQTQFKTLHAFRKSGGGQNLFAGLVFGDGGNLYGTAADGGKYNYGVVFMLARNAKGNWTETVIHNFCSRSNCTDGRVPLASLVSDTAGNLYGTTVTGGGSNAGAVFELSPNADGSWTERVLYSFAGGNDGAMPTSSLIFDQSGNLYGTTLKGGQSPDAGTVFRLAPNQNGGWTESVLYNFCSLTNCIDGAQPYAGLTFDQSGNLYGTTLKGGQSPDAGTVFRLAPNQNGGWTESVLYNFCSLTNCTDGFEPYAGVILDHAGNLYGATWEGGAKGAGVVFQVTANKNGTPSETVLHSFCSEKSCSDGEEPFAALIPDAQGNLYGTAYYGGTSGYGVVFKLTPNARGEWRETRLHSFANHPGISPMSNMIFDAAGNLYGTTSGEGGVTFGSAFEITPQ